MHSQNSYVEVAGAQLETKTIVPGTLDPSLPTLVLLHEGLGCVDMWRDFPEQLVANSGCPVVVYSRQGYGRSSPCALPRPLSYMHTEALDVLPQFISKIELSDYILIGHSDGASIALIHAGSEKRQGLKGVVSMAPHVFCETLSVAAIEKAKTSFIQGQLADGLRKYHGENTDCAFWGWNGAWLDPDFMHWNIEEYLPGIEVSQLLIQSRDDPYGTVAQLNSIAQHSGGKVETCLLDNCGHSPFRDQPETTLNLIADFITQQTATQDQALGKK